MFVKNKHTGLEIHIDLSQKRGIKMAQLVYPDDNFEVIEMTDEEKELLTPPESELEKTIEDEILVDDSDEDKGEKSPVSPKNKQTKKVDK